MESFHEFYATVEINYQRHFYHNDVKNFANPLLDCEPETMVNETEIKVEVNPFDSSMSDYDAVFVPSTTYWDDSNKQIDSFTEEAKNLLAPELTGNSNELLSVNQEHLSTDRTIASKKLKISNKKSTIRKRKKTVKTKWTSKKANPKKVRKNIRIVDEIT